MKTIALTILSVIALLPLPAIAKPYSELGLPACYIITSTGRLINLNYMCNGGATSNQVQSSPKSSITASDVCRAFASDVLTAQNQFQRDRANEGLKYCLQNKDSIQQDINNGK